MKDILDKITGKNRSLNENDICHVHHELMCCYGWIPFEEFKALPLPTLFELYNCAMQERQKRENLRLVLLKFCGVKNPK